MVEVSSPSDAAGVPSANLESHLRIPVGVLSPLWFVYAGAAGAGAAAWWMTRWMQPVNLEAVWGKSAPVEVASEAMTPEPAPQPREVSPPSLTEAAAAAPTQAEEAVAAVVEAAVEPVAPGAAPVERPAPESPTPRAVKAAAPKPPAAAAKPKTASRSRSGASQRKGGPSPTD